MKIFRVRSYSLWSLSLWFGSVACLTLSAHPAHWHLYYSCEVGLRVIQCGPLTLEMGS